MASSGSTLNRGPDPNTQVAYKHTLTERNIALVLNEAEPPPLPLIKVSCMIGPACDNIDMLVSMMEAGMNIAKVSCARGTQAEYAATIARIREAGDVYSRGLDLVYPLAVALDTKGLEIQLGRMEGGEAEVIELLTGSTLTVTSDPAYKDSCSREVLYVDYPQLTHDMEPSFPIYISFGFVKLMVTEVGRADITCLVESGGKVQSYDLVNFPSNYNAKPQLSDKDKSDIRFGAEQKVDIIMASTVHCPEAITEIRDILGDKGKNIVIIAEIEDQEGLDNIDDIIKVADGIIIARGNLGINIEGKKLFIIQKMIMAKCHMAGKPVLIGTQILASMMHHPVATSSEISDIANAVTEGADVILLNHETAKGRYPLECVKLLREVCREAEHTSGQKHVFSDLCTRIQPPVDPVTAVSIATVKAAIKIGACAIITTTTSGKTAVWLARFRPPCPIIAVTLSGCVARELQVYKAIKPLHYISPPMADWLDDIDARLQFGICYGKRTGYVRKGKFMLLVSGWQRGAGFTNTIRLAMAGDD